MTDTITKEDWNKGKGYSFFGISMVQSEYEAACKREKSGGCPFCNKTGMTARYGSQAKHIRRCAKNRIEELIAKANFGTGGLL